MPAPPDLLEMRGTLGASVLRHAALHILRYEVGRLALPRHVAARLDGKRSGIRQSVEKAADQLVVLGAGGIQTHPHDHPISAADDLLFHVTFPRFQLR